MIGAEKTSHAKYQLWQAGLTELPPKNAANSASSHRHVTRVQLVGGSAPGTTAPSASAQARAADAPQPQEDLSGDKVRVCHMLHCDWSDTNRCPPNWLLCLDQWHHISHILLLKSHFSKNSFFKRYWLQCWVLIVTLLLPCLVVHLSQSFALFLSLRFSGRVLF